MFSEMGVAVVPRTASAIVLAGGFGTRIRHLLPDVPKPLAPVAGRTFLEWLLRYLRKQGIGQVAISTGHLAEKVDDFVRQIQLPDLSIICARETTPLGTAGGFLNALATLPLPLETVFVCNGDSIVLAELEPAWTLLADPRIDGVMFGLHCADASRFGSMIVKNGHLSGFAEKRAGSGLINGGIYFFRRKIVDSFPRILPLSFEFDVFPALLSEGARIAVIEMTAPFLDIGTETSLGAAESFIHSNRGWFL
jgi:NDP-sugar pyrophosphorylase family protein